MLVSLLCVWSVVRLVLMLYSHSRGYMHVYIPVMDLRVLFFDCHCQLLEQCT